MEKKNMHSSNEHVRQATRLSGNSSPRHWTVPKRPPVFSPLTPLILASLGGFASFASANNITVDGLTDTSLEVDGNLTNIHTGTRRNGNAFNSFRHFELDEGNRVVLHLETGDKNLVNLVRDSRAMINGTLESMQDGTIGRGNIIFADPHGFLVGANGVINVGSLLVTTPTATFMDQVISPDGVIDDTATAQLLSGNAPLAKDAVISIDGQVNAAYAIQLHGGAVQIEGTLRAGASAQEALFQGSVNTEGFNSGGALIEDGGEIRIVSAGDAQLHGKLDVSGKSGGLIRVRAGQDVTTASGTYLTASADGDSPGDAGLIDIWADRDGYLTGQLFAASEQGDGGFIEFSAAKRIDIMGVQVDVSAANGGTDGLFYIDPEHIVLGSGDHTADFTVAGNALLEATESITLQDGATIDTGNTTSSGNITLRAPGIELQAGSSLLATDGTGGNILLEAIRSVDVTTYGAADVNQAASIIVNGMLHGANIEMRAYAQVNASPTEIPTYTELTSALPTGFQTEFGTLPDVSFAFASAKVDATIDIGINADIQATGDVSMHARATRTAAATADTTGGISAAAALSFLEGDTRVAVASGAKLSAGGALNLRAESINNLTATAEAAVTDLNGIALGGSVALGFVDTSTQVSLDAAATSVSAGSIAMLADSTDSYEVSASTQPTSSGSAGIAAAVLDVETATRARLAGTITTAGDVSVIADSTVNAATSRAATGGNPPATLEEELSAAGGDWYTFIDGLAQIADVMAADEVATDDGEGGEGATPGAGGDGGMPFDFGSSMSLMWLDDTTEALIASDAQTLDATGTQLSAADVTVAAQREIAALANQAVSDMTSTAEDGAGATVAISAALAFADINNRTRAHLGSGVVVTADRLGVAADFVAPAAAPWGSDTGPGSLDDLEAATDEQLSAWATSRASASTATAGTLSVAGAASILLVDTTVEAWLGDQANITLNGAAGAWTSSAANGLALAWTDSLHLNASSELATLSMVGNGGGSDGVGIGGGVNWDARRTVSRAGAGTGLNLTGSGSTPGVAVNAARNDSQITATTVSGESGGAAGLGAALAIGQLNGSTTAALQGGTLDGIGDLLLSADGETENAVLVASRISGGTVGLAATLALANLNTAERATMIGNSPGAPGTPGTPGTPGIVGDLSVVTRSRRSHEVTALAEAKGSVGLGVAAAIADVKATTETLLSGNFHLGGTLSLFSTSDSSASIVMAETSVAPADESGSTDSTAVEPEPSVAEDDGGSNQYIQSRAGGKTDEVESAAGQGTGGGGGSAANVKLGAAIALSDVDQASKASLADSASVTTAGDVAIVADLTDGGVQTHASAGAESTVDDSGTGVSAAGAVALDFRDNDASALIGQNVQVQAARIGVGAEAAMPLSASLSWGDFLDLDAIYTEFTGVDGTPLTDKLREAMRGYASATVATGSKDIGLSGSVNYGELNTNARAWVAQGSNLTATGSLPVGATSWTATLDEGVTRSWQDTLAVTADSDTRSLEVAGNLSSLFSGNSGDGSRALMGGSFNWADRGGATVAGIGANTTISADSIGVRADRFDQLITVTPGAGQGAGITGTGMISFSRIGGSSHASISNSADVTADSVAVDALHDLSLWTVAGAVSRGENVGVGVALAINDLQSNTRAWIGDNSSDAPVLETPTQTGVVRTNELAVTATSRGRVASAAVAGAEVSKSPATGGLNDTVGSAAQGRTDAAEQRSSDAANSDDPALADSQQSASEKSAWKDADGKQSTQPSNSASSKSNKGGIGLSVAGGATVNISALTTRAEVTDVTIQAREAASTVDLNVRAINDADMLGFAGGGALTRAGGGGSGFKAALAGSLAFNHLQNKTTAVLSNSTVNDANSVAVEALTAGDQIALGLGVAITAGAKNGMSAAGSASVGYVANASQARIENSVLNLTGDLDVTAYDRSRIANGGGALSVSGKGAVGAAVTVGIVENDLDAEIKGGSVSGANSVDVSALSSTLVLGGAAMATVVTGGSTGGAANGSAVVNTVDSDITARIYNGALIGSGASLTDVGQVQVQAKGTSGVAHLDALVGGRSADADTVFDIATLFDSSRGAGQEAPANGPESPKDPDAGYETGASTDIAAPTGNGEAVIGIAGSVSVGGAASLGLSFAGNFVSSEYTASIDDAQVESLGAVDLSASDSAVVAGLAVGASATSGKFAGMGSVTVNRISSSADAGVGRLGGNLTTIDAASLSVNADKGADIFALAGSVAFSGKAGVGLSVGYNEVANTINSGLRNANVTVTGITDITADSDADIYSAAISGAAAGGVALGGSVNVNRIGQIVRSSVDQTTLQATSLQVLAGDTDGGTGANIWSLAGDIKGGGKAAVGVSLATNLVSSQYSGQISNSGLTLSDSLDLRSRSAGNIRTLGVSGGGAGKLAAGAAVATGDFKANTTASLSNSSVDASSANVLVNAADDSQIQTFSASLQIGGFAGAAGAATVNTINNTVRAEINGTPTGKQIHAANVLVDARSEAGIGTVALGAAGGGKAGLSGSVATSILRTTTLANVGGGADLLAEGHVGVFARTDDAIGAAAGSAGIGVMAVGAAGSVTVNVLESDTEASITGATTRVRAKQSGTGLTASTGHLQSKPTGNPFAQIFEVDDTSGTGEPTASDFGSYQTPTLGAATRSVGGVVVDALSLQQVDSVLGSLGVSANVIKGGAGLAGTVNTTVLGGETRALVDGATIGDSASPDAYGDLTVVSGHHSYGTSIALGLAAGSGGAMGAVSVDVFEGRSVAAVRDAEVYSKGLVDIDAVSSQGLLGVAAGAAIGTYVGAAGSGTVSVFSGESLAEIVGASTVDAQQVDVDADSDSHLELVAAAFSGSGAVAAAGTFVVAVSETETTARIGDGLTGSPTVTADGSVKVNADNRTEFKGTVASAAASGVGAVTGSVSTPIILNKTTASVNGATLNVGAALDVTASDVLRMNSAAGGGAFSYAASGAAGVNVGVVKSQTLAEIINSDVNVAGNVNVDALRDADLSLETWLATASIMGAGISGGVGVLVLGESLDNNVSDDTNGDLSSELGSGNGDWLNKSTTFSSKDHLAGDGDRSEGTLSGESYGKVGATDVNGAVYSPASDSTMARIEGGTLDAIGNVTVGATDRSTTSNNVGSFAFGQVGVGGSVAVTQVNSDVGARVNGTLNAGSLSIDALATNGAAKAVDVLAITGAVGSVGLGAAVGVGMFDGSVTAEIGGAVNTGSGAITVEARDETDAEAQGLAAQAGSLAAGVAVGVADKSTSVATRALSGTVDGGSISLSSRSNGDLNGVAQGASGGLGGAATGAVALALDAANVSTTATAGSRLRATNTLALTSDARSGARAETLGVNVSGGVSVGASVAIARSQARSLVTVEDNASLSGDSLNIAALSGRGADGSADSVWSRAIGASGGLLVGVDVTVAEADYKAHTEVNVRSGASLSAATDLSVAALANASQYSQSTGISLGALAAGASAATTRSSGTTIANLDGAVLGRPDQVLLSARSTNRNRAHAIAGSGGVLAGSAAVVITADNSRTTAQLQGGSHGQTLEADRVNVLAQHTSNFEGKVDSVRASLLGASGAWAEHDITTNVNARVGGSADIRTKDFALTARSVAEKEGDGYSVHSGSGGVIDGAAARSQADITLNTAAVLANNAKVDVEGDWRDPGHLRITAENVLDTSDRVRLDSGGAIAIAMAQSFSTVNSNAAVTVGDGVNLTSVGEVALGSRTDADVRNEANAKTYGAAGAARGESAVTMNTNHDVSVGANSYIKAYGDVRLTAGRDAQDRASTFDLTARTDLWNNTAFPVNTDPEADVRLNQSNDITVAQGAQVRSVRNVGLLTDEGRTRLSGDGTGKDLYRKAAEDIANGIGSLVGAGEVSLEIKAGSTNQSHAGVVRVDGTVEAGIHHKQILHFTGDFNASGDLVIDTSTLSEGITYRVVDGHYTQTILNRIDELYSQRDEYASSPTEHAAFTSEIKLLEDALFKLLTEELGYEASDVRTSDGRLIAAPAMPIRIIEVDPILAQVGNIEIDGDALVGNGVLDAPGDAKIEILNPTAAFLRTDTLSIPNEDGGQVLFNGGAVSSIADINARNATGYSASFSEVRTGANSAAPLVKIENSFNPADFNPADYGLNPDDVEINPLPTDIFVEGNITNLGGSVEIDSTRGSIYVSGDIRAFTVDIGGGGNIVLSYKDSFRHTGGDPRVDGSGGHTIAGNNLIASAQFLNINGLLQSGIANWKIVFDEAADNLIESARLDYLAGRTGAKVRIKQTDVRKGLIGYSYDFENERILLDPVEVAGGYMELTGKIMNTGGGQLKIMDGYGQVQVVNNTSRTLDIGGIDLGNEIEGVLRLNDAGLKGDDSQILSTIYTHVGDDVQVFHGAYDQISRTSDYLSNTLLNTRNASYSPRAGLDFVWLEGKTYARERVVKKYWDTALGIFPSGSGTTASDTGWVANDDSTPLEEAEYVGFKTTAGVENFITDGEELISTKNWWTCEAHFITCLEWRLWEQKVYEDGALEITRYVKDADKAIAIEFIGYDAGDVNVQSLGDIIVGGSVNNAGGLTALNSKGSINQDNASAAISGKSLNISAATGIGDQGSLRVKVGDDGLTAVTTTGDIELYGVGGNVKINQLRADNGDVTLSSQVDIVNGSATSLVRGNDVHLTSRQGRIGSAADALRIDSGYVNAGSVIAKGSQGAHLLEIAGDMRVERIESSGRIDVTVVNGDLVDANTNDRRDTRREAELLALWSDMSLTGVAAEQALVEEKQSQRDAGQARYERYWRMRGLSGNATDGFDAEEYNPDYQATLSIAERNLLATRNGWTDQQIADYESTLTADYHAMHAEFNEPASYDPTFTYVLSADAEAALEEGAVWTEDQLKNSVSRGLIEKDAGGSAVIEDANIVGADVYIRARNIGSTLANDVVLDLSNGIDGLTSDDLLALSSAEYDDVSFDESNAYKLTIVQREDVDIRASGAITAIADQDIFLGGQTDFNLYDVNGGAVRVMTDGTILTANAGEVVLTGTDVILESVAGKIGTEEAAIHTDIDGSLTARSGGEIHLVQADTLNLARAYAPGVVDITITNGSLLALYDEIDTITGGMVDLNVSGDIGTATRRMDIVVGPTDSLSAITGGNAWLGAGHKNLRIDELQIGGNLDVADVLDLDSLGKADISGNVKLVTTTDWTMDSASTLNISGWLHATIGSHAELSQINVSATGADSLTVDARSIGASDEKGFLKSAGEIVLTTLDDIAAADLALRLDTPEVDVLSHGGDIYLDFLSTVGSGSVAALLGDIRLTGDKDVTLSQILATNGNITADRVVGHLDVDLLDGGRHVWLDAGSAELTVARSGQNFWLQTADDQQLGSISSGGNTALVSRSGSIFYDALSARSTLAINAAGTVRGREAKSISTLSIVGEDLDLTTTASRNGKVSLQSRNTMTIDQLTATVALTARAGGSLSYNNLDVFGDIYLVSNADILGTNAQAGGLLALDGGNLDLGTLTSSSGNVMVTSRGTLDLDLANAATELNLTTGGLLTYGELNAGNTLTITGAADVIGSTATAASDLRISAENLTLSSIESTGAGVALSSRAAMNVSTSVTAATDLNLQAGGNLSYNRATAGATSRIQSDAVISGTTAVAASTLEVSGGELALTTVESTGADVVLTSQEGMGLGRASAATDLVLTAGGNLSYQTLLSGNQLFASSVRDITGDIATAGTGVVMSGERLDLNSVTSSTADVDLTSRGTMTLDQVNAATAIALNAGGNLGFTQLLAGGTVSVAGAADIVGASAQGSALSVWGENLNLTSVSSTGGAVNLSSRNSMVLDQVDSFSSLQLSAGGNIHYNRLFSGTTMAIASAADVEGLFARAGDTFSIDASNLKLTETYSTRADVAVWSTGNSVLEQVDAANNVSVDAGAGLGFTNLQAGNTLTTLSGGDTTGINATAGGALLMTGENLQLGTADSRGASVTVISRGAMTVDQLSAATDMQLTAGAQLSYDQIQAGAAMTVASDADIQGRDTTAAGTLLFSGENLALTTIRSSGGDASLTSRGKMTLGELSAHGGIALTAGDQLGYDTLAAGTTLRVSGQAAVVGVTATAGADTQYSALSLDVTSVVTATGNMALTAIEAAAAEQLESLAGDIVVTAGSTDLALVTSAGALTVQTSGNQQLGTLASTADMTLNSDLGSIVYGSLDSAASLTMNAAATISGAWASAATELSASGRDLNLGTTSSRRGGIALASVDTMTLEQTTAAGNLAANAGASLSFTELQAGGAINLVGASTITGDTATAAGNLTIDGQNLNLATLESTGGAVSASSGDTLLLNLATASSDIQLVAGGALSYSELRAGEAITVAADGDVSGSQAIAGTQLSVSAENLSLTAAESTGGSIVLNSRATMNLEQISADVDLTATAGGVMTYTLLQSGGAMKLSGSAAITGANASADGAVDISGDELLLGQVTSRGASVDLSSRGDMNLDQVTAFNELTLSAAGLLDYRDLQAGGLLSMASLSDITGQTARAAAADVTGRNVDLASLESTQGNISLASLETMTLGQITAAQNLLAEPVGELTFTELNSGEQMVLAGSVDISGSSANAGADLTVSAANLNLASASAGERVKLVSRATMTLDQVNAGSDMALTAGGALVFDALQAGANLEINGDGNVTGATATAAASLLARGADVSLDSVHSSGADVAIGSTGTLFLDLAVAATSMSVDAGSSLSYTDLQAGGALSITAGGDILGQSANAGGHLLVDGAGSVDLTTTQSDGDAAIISVASMTLDTLTAVGDIDLNAGANLDYSSLNAGGALRLAATGDLVGGSTLVGAALEMSGDNLTLGSVVSSGANASLTSRGLMTVDQVSAATDLDLAAGGNLVYDELQAGGALTVVGAMDVIGNSATADSVTMQADNLNLLFTSAIAGDMVLTSRGGLSLGEAEADVHMNLTSGGNLGYTTLQAGGTLSASSVGDIVGASATAGDGLALTGENLSLTNLESQAGALQLTSRGSMDVTQAMAATGMALTAGGTIAYQDLRTSAGATLDSAGDIQGASLSAAAEIVANGGKLAMSNTASSGGGVSLSSRDSMDLEQVTAAGAIDLSAGGDLTYQLLQAGESLTILGQKTIAGESGIAGDKIHYLGEQITLESLLSEGGDIALTASEGVIVGDLHTSAGAIAVSGASSDLAQVIAGGALNVSTTGDQQLGAAYSSGAMRLEAGGDIGYAQLTGDDALEIEAAGLVSGTLTSFAGALAFFGEGAYVLDQVESLSAGVKAAVGGHFEATSLRALTGAIDLNAGAAMVADGEAGQTITISTVGTQRHGRLVAGQDLFAQAGADFSAATLASVDGTRIDAGSAAVDAATSGSDIRISTAGDQNLGKLEAAGLIDLEAGASIRFRELLAGREGAEGGDIHLQSHNGSIDGQYAAANRDLYLSALNGELDLAPFATGSSSLEAGRDIRVALGGDLNSAEGEIKAGRHIDISTLGTADRAGNIMLGGLLAESGQADLSASGDIRVRVGAAGGSGQIQVGSALNLNALGHVEVQKQISAGAGVAVDAGGNAQLSGIVSGGSQILHAGGLFSADYLNSQSSVTIGSADRRTGSVELGRVDAHSSVDIHTLGDQRVNYLQSGGDMNLDAGGGLDFIEIVSSTGDLYLLARTGELRGERLEGSRVEARAGIDGDRTTPAGIIAVDEVIARDLALWAPTEIAIDLARLERSGQFAADKIDLNILHTSNVGSLQLNSAALDGGVAAVIDLDIDTAADVEFGHLAGADVRIATSGPVLRIDDGFVPGRMELTTAVGHLVMDNLRPNREAADVQLYEADFRFSLEQNGMLTDTDAYVLAYGERYQVQVPNLQSSRRNSQVIYEGSSAIRDSERALQNSPEEPLLAQATRPDDSILFELISPALNGSVNLDLLQGFGEDLPSESKDDEEETSTAN